jgi:hypothetical protein
MDINLPNSASDTVSGVGKIGSRGINTTNGFMWNGYQRSRTRRYS